MFGSVGDFYDNALAETLIGLYKTEVIHARGPWRTLDAVESPVHVPPSRFVFVIGAPGQMASQTTIEYHEPFSARA